MAEGNPLAHLSHSRTKIFAVASLASRVFGQGMMALTSFLVSFSAAHSLDASHLAVFFVAWTLESMWIAALRTIFVPAFLSSQRRPGLLSLMAIQLFMATPISLGVFCVAFLGGLGVGAGILLALTPFSFGVFEVVRTFLSVSMNSRMSSADSAMLVISGGFFLGGVFLFDLIPLHSALLGVILGSTGVAALYGWRSCIPRDAADSCGSYVWVKEHKGLLRVGLLEWAIFFTISMAGVSLLGGLGGAEVLSGVRLAETLMAPLSIAGSAIPLILAPYMSVISRGDQGWPGVAKLVTWGFSVGAIAWISAIMIIPLEWLELLVGEHGELAKMGLAGLAFGAVVSFLSTTVSLMLKSRGLLRQVRVVRWVQLVISMPLVALGAIWGDVFLAGLGMAAHQVIACALLLLAERRARG